MEVKLIELAEQTQAYKTKRMEWSELNPDDVPSDSNFDFNNIDNMWYRHLDDGSFL